MSPSQTPSAGAFDDYINTDSATLAPPLNEEQAASTEVKAKKAAKPPKAPMGKKQKVMLFGGVGALVLVGAIMLGKEDPPPPVSPDVAAILAAANPPVPGQVMEDAPFAGFEDVTPVAASELESSGDPTLDALNATLAGDALFNADAAEVAPVMATEAEAPHTPAPPPSVAPAVPAIREIAATETAPTLDQATRMRIEGLQNDLKRAQDARRAAERNQRVPVTVVAVLDDGVVVRDARGREKVFAVGEQVKL